MRKPTVLGSLLVAAGMLGCQATPHARVNAPPQGYSAYRHPTAQMYQAMTTNAVAIEMRVTDHHFKPASPTLNDSGRAALNEIAQAIRTDGGQVFYRSATAAPELYAARVATIRHYLVDVAGLTEGEAEVVKGYAEAPGMEGIDAVAILNNARKALVSGPKGGGQAQSLIGGG